MKSKFLGVLAVAALLVTSCSQKKYEKLEGGLDFRVIKGNGEVLKYGATFEFSANAIYSYKDSALVPADQRVNQIGNFDSTAMGPVFKAFKGAQVGDSIILRQSTDTMMKQNPTQMPPWIKKGQFIYRTFKIVAILKDSAAITAANERLALATKVADSLRFEKMKKEDEAKRAKQIVNDDKVITAYLAKNNIKATKTAMGTYIETITPGTGTITDSFAVTVKYTGRNFAGKVFDSNTDTAFKHVEPFTVYLFYPNQVIKGWEDALKQLGMGAKARLYIPSALAYGEEGRGAESGIGPNENLIFDMEVIGVEHRKTAQAKFDVMIKKEQEKMRQQQAMQQAMQQMQQQQQSGGQPQQPR